MSTSPLPPDPYEALGLGKDADSDTVKKAHRRLVLKHHPDRIKDPTQIEHNKNEFQKVQQAYEILIDPIRRQRYDDQVRLAQLRAERLMSERNERSSPRTSYTAAFRPAPASHVSYRDFPRDGPRDSPREMPRDPRSTPRYATEERAPESYFESMSPRYDEGTIPTTNIRKASYEKRPSASKSSEKKTSSKSSGWDRRPGGGGIGSAMFFKDKAKSAKQKVSDDKNSRARDAKARDKEERRGRAEKEQRTQPTYSAASYVSDDESSDSDTIIMPRRSDSYRSSARDSPRARSPQTTSRSARPRSPTRTKSPISRSRRALTPEQDRTRPQPRQYHSDVGYDSPDDQDEWEGRHNQAFEYIKQARADARMPPRPPLSRQGSAHQYWDGQRMPFEKDHHRSGSDSDRQRNGGSHARRGEQVESEQIRRPAMPSHTSAPAGVRGMSNSASSGRMGPLPQDMPGHRSRQGSFDSRNYRHQAFDQPELKRTSSDPVSPRMPVRKDTNPMKPSNLKQTETNHDSGYGTSSTSHTPEMRGESRSPPRPTTTTRTYRAKKEDEDKGYRIRPVESRGRKSSPDGKARRTSPDPKSKRAVSPETRVPRSVVDDGDNNRHLRPEPADEKRDRRRSRSRSQDTQIRSTRSASNRPAPTSRPSTLNREGSTFAIPGQRGRAVTEDRIPDLFKQKVDPSKAKYAMRNEPVYNEYRPEPSITRGLKTGRKASVY